jgi:transposase InsO family protein
VKKHAVKLRTKTSRRRVAAGLGVSTSRLARWENARPSIRPVGRPLATLDAETESDAREFLERHGAATGAPRLCGHFPGASPRALLRLLKAFRQERVRGRTEVVTALTWTTPGTVWAIDYTEPPSPVDGQLPSILSVRDLASGKHLVAAPVEAATAEATRCVLEGAFAEHGAPLVLKHDNGSHFTAGLIAATLAPHGVVSLPSPPRRPGYNGSCEAGIGALKLRASREAARHGRFGYWTSDDVAVACDLGNATGRPWGPRRQTPNEAWAARRALAPGERDAFLRAVRRSELDLLRERGCVDMPTELNQRNSIKRQAVRRALVASGFLFTSRRRVRLPILALLRRRIS